MKKKFRKLTFAGKLFINPGCGCCTWFNRPKLYMLNNKARLKDALKDV